MQYRCIYTKRIITVLRFRLLGGTRMVWCSHCRLWHDERQAEWDGRAA
jgi:hypothetical protein